MAFRYFHVVSKLSHTATTNKSVADKVALSIQNDKSILWALIYFPVEV
jgi:hypothetical protein